MVSRESRRDGFEAHEATDQQPGAGHQHQGKRQFGNHQEAAQPVPRQTQTSVTLPATPARLERRVQVHPQGAPRRRNAKQDARQDRNAEREGQNRTVDFDVVQSRDVAWIHGAYHVKRPARDQQADCATDHRHQQAFRKQLADDPRPARSQSGADGNFLLASRGAREQQVGYVRARDQQNQRHRAEQHQQCAAHVAHYLFLQPDHSHTERAIAFVLLPNAAGDDVDIRLRLPHRNARLQPHHHVVILVSALLRRIRSERERREYIRLIHGTFGGHGFGAEHEIRTQHAGHGALLRFRA